MRTQTHPHRHSALFFSRPDPLYAFDGPIHVVCDVDDSPLPCCPAFKLWFSSGSLSPGVDCIFYLSFSLPWLYLPKLKKKKKICGENCNQHNMPSSCCVLACHSPLSVSMQDETDSPCRRRHTHGHTDACTTPLCVYQTPTHTRLYPSLPVSLFLSLFHTQKHVWLKKMTPLPLFLPIFFHSAHIHRHAHTSSLKPFTILPCAECSAS